MTQRSDHRGAALCPYCGTGLYDGDTITRARGGDRIHADCLALSHACAPDHGDLGRLLAARLRRIEQAITGLAEAQPELWDETSELRDEIHDLSARVTNVHTAALRSLTARYATKGEPTDD